MPIQKPGPVLPAIHSEHDAAEQALALPHARPVIKQTQPNDVLAQNVRNKALQLIEYAKQNGIVVTIGYDLEKAHDDIGFKPLIEMYFVSGDFPAAPTNGG